MGGYGGFDGVAASAVKNAKQQHPDIVLMLVFPYHPAERPIEKPSDYDGTYYPEGLEKTPRPFAIVKANQLMVDSCDWLICYVRHGASNSRNLLEYAQCQEKRGLFKLHILLRGLAQIYEKEITVVRRNHCFDRSGYTGSLAVSGSAATPDGS